MKFNLGKTKTGRILLVIFAISCLGMTFKYYDSISEFWTSYRIFDEIYKRIREDYVEETKSADLMQNAINGMISNLDPHSKFLKSDYFKKFNQNYAGYSGIGISFDVIRKQITIMSVFRGGPSDKAGLLAGDRIVSIDGESAIGMDRDEAPAHLMGPQGSKVSVSIARHGVNKTQDYVLIRDKIHVESIPYGFILKPGLGYINIIRFSATTGEELKKHLVELKAQGMKKLILDLRNNGGGYLNPSAEVVDRFLSRGKKIVYTKGRNKESFRQFYTTNQLTFKNIPLIILIDRFSASASEIVSGALQDWDRALIVGETSFGKGLVQSQYRFNDGSALLMTTARYYTPIGRMIQRPYSNISLEDYYIQIADDSLRKAWENNPDRPTYTTKILGRKVLGGGGITPDIFFKTKQDTISTIVRRLVTSPKRLYFTFVEDYLNNQSSPKINLADFLRDYQPNGKLLTRFLGYIREMNFVISDSEFEKNKLDIQFFLKQNIADQIWGDEARYKVQLLRDNQFIESTNYIDQAEKLLKLAYH